MQRFCFLVSVFQLLCWHLPTASAQGTSAVINVEWSDIIRKLNTTPALQVVVNPLIMRDSPVHDALFANLKALGANYVRFVPWLPYPGLGVAELEPPSGSKLCGFRSTDNGEVPLQLSCAGHGTIASIDFASFGTPGGYCGSLHYGSCHAQNSAQVVEKACLGQVNCTLVSSVAFFGGSDPCVDTAKNFAVQVTCSLPANHTYWDFSLLDPLMEDFMDAAQADGHTVIINFSTPPQWLYATPDRVPYPDDAHLVDWGYEQGTGLVDPTAETFGAYYGRLVAWYTQGGFTDEYGTFHASGHKYNISIWECLNELEHGLSAPFYTQLYDSMVSHIKADSPQGAANMKFMGGALGGNSDDFWAYFLNMKNHAPGIAPPDYMSFHYYASCAVRGDPDNYAQFFDGVDGIVPGVTATVALRDAMAPGTKIDMDELGVILPDDNDPKYTSDDPGFPPVYWNAAGAMYAYLFARLSVVGVDILGESQFVGYPMIPDYPPSPNLSPQFPSVAMTNWTTGAGTARYWVLKLLLDETELGFDMPNTTVIGGAPQPQNPFCGSIINLQDLTLICTEGVIDKIEFASYGTPTGSCPDWQVGACNAANTTSIVEGFCLGQSQCTVPADTPHFGDPCFGTVKYLDVVAHCSTGGGYQPTTPTVHAQAFVTADGTRKVLVINKRNQQASITLPGASGSTMLYVDESTGDGPYQAAKLTSDTFVLNPYAVGLVTFAG